MPMSLVQNMKLSRVVRATARLVAEVVGDAKTASGAYVNDVLEVVRGRARAWVRDAYLIGYRDGVEDVIRAISWDGDWPEFERAIRDAADRRVDLERQADTTATTSETRQGPL